MKFSVLVISIFIILVNCTHAQQLLANDINSRVVDTSNYQADTLRQFYNSLWKPCAPQQSSFYTVAYKHGDSWIVEDYYVQQKSLKSYGSFADKELKNKKGNFLYYRNDGSLEAEANYINGQRNGWCYNYQKDGNSIADSLFFINGMPTGRSIVKYTNGGLKTEQILDQYGTGYGTFKSFREDGQIMQEGSYSAGVKKDSIWTFYHLNGKISFLQYFRTDSLISQICYDSLGKRLKKCVEEQLPEFPGGIKSLNQFLISNIRFPKGYNIDISPQRIVLRFAVEEDGTIGDITFLRSLHPAFDNEAMRVIKAMPKWKPGFQFHEPKSVYYILPISFAQN